MGDSPHSEREIHLSLRNFGRFHLPKITSLASSVARRKERPAALPLQIIMFSRRKVRLAFNFRCARARASSESTGGDSHARIYRICSVLTAGRPAPPRREMENTFSSRENSVVLCEFEGILTTRNLTTFCGNKQKRREARHWKSSPQKLRRPPAHRPTFVLGGSGGNERASEAAECGEIRLPSLS